MEESKELVECYKTDAAKMFAVMKKLVEVQTKSLVPPNELPPNQAYGYQAGSTDAFKRCGKMAEAALNEIVLDYTGMV